MGKTRTFYQNTEKVVYVDETTSVKRMQNKDTDGDGICDLYDREYNKPSMEYLEIDQAEYDRLMASDVQCEVRKSKDDNKYIVELKSAAKAEILNIIKKYHTITKHI